MALDKEIAHFFWHGTLTKMEEVCVQSFVEKGFDVRLWSYNNLHIEGATSYDARLVLPEEDLTKYKYKIGPLHTEGNNDHVSITAFCEAFRLHVMDKFGGWWFDADCFCLKTEQEFKKLKQGKRLVSGLMTFNQDIRANGAVMYADKETRTKLVNKLNSLCEYYNYTFPQWGVIGPDLVDLFALEENLYEELSTSDVFYPIHFLEMDYFTEPELLIRAKARIKNSYVLHLWHTQHFLGNVNKVDESTPSLIQEIYNGEYTPNVRPDTVITRWYADKRKRYVDICKLYNEVLQRPADRDGMIHYYSSDLPICHIKDILTNSDEYRNLQ
jgi:hypothetical protein